MKSTDAAYPSPSSDAVSRVMRANRKTDSRPETALRRELFRRGRRYRKNPALRTSAGLIRPDIVFLRERLAVFVDGCFWHSCPLHGNSPRTNAGYWGPKLQRNRERDMLVTAALESDGWTVIRVWEHDSTAEAALRVELALRERTG